MCSHHSTRQLRSRALLGLSLVVLAIAFAFGFAPGSLQAGEPEEPIISVEPWDSLEGIFLAPAFPNPIPGTTAHMIIHNSADQPVPNASVVILLNSNNPLCPGAVVTGTTDALGEVDITVSGGGCSHQEPLAGLIKVNGVTVRAYPDVKSPDFDGQGSNGIVALADLLAFSNEFLQLDPAGCHDYDNDGITGLADLILFAPAFVQSAHCD